MQTALMIAAPASGCGKTTLARGLMALFTRKGFRVQPFKCGPDYIDTKFHAAVCGRPSVNLDTFMATPDHVWQLFAHYGAEADVCVVEGMMGLFDGYARDRGSSAEIASILGLPVVLVVDARSAAYSTAALLSGFLRFRDDVHIAGVLFNKVGSQRHQEALRQVCDDLHVECLGCLPRTAALEQGSRYLGLDFSQSAASDELVALLEEKVAWQQILALEAQSPKPKVQSSGLKVDSSTRLVVARNAEAFSFLYQETLDRFRNVAFFDPETEVPDLRDTDLLYLPGGYPEKHLDALAAAQATRQAIRHFAEQGGRVVAECGGMMYLCREIIADAPVADRKPAADISASVNGASPAAEATPVDGTSVSYPMCGVLPYAVSARRADRKLSLGYRQFTLDGRHYRGHEFHYTQFVGPTPPSAAQICDAAGNPVPTPVFKYKNVLASYTHLYPL